MSAQQVPRGPDNPEESRVISVHPGKINDADEFSAFIERLKAADDIREVFAAMPVFVQLDAGNYQHALSLLKEHYGRRLDLQALKRAVKNEREGQKLVRRQKRAQARNTAVASLPAVIVNGRWTIEISQEIFAHLVKAQEALRVFRRGSELVRVIQEADGSSRIATVDKSSLRYLIERTVRCVTIRETEEGDIPLPDSVPEDVVTYLLEMHDWPGIPVLDGVTDAPYIRADGHVCTTPGYDPVARLLYIPREGLHIPNIPENPTQEDARHAARSLLAIYEDYPFAHESYRANLLGAMLTLALREAISGYVPVCVIDATRARSGKTELARSIVAAGRGDAHVSTDPWPKDEIEVSKKILAKLKAGARVTLFDNIRGKVSSEILESLTTSEDHQNRILGVTDEGNYPNRLFNIFTMNGAQFGGDMWGRLFFIRLNYAGLHPERRNPRQFKIGMTLKDYVRLHAGEMLAHVLTMARAWYVAECPISDNVQWLASFENWCETITSVLDFSGVPGFLATQWDDSAQTDEEGDQYEHWLLAVHEHYGSETFTANQIATAMLTEPKDTIAKTLPDYLADKFDERMSPVKLATYIGYALRPRKGRRFGRSGVHIICVGHDDENARQWQVIKPEVAQEPPRDIQQPPAPVTIAPSAYADLLAGLPEPFPQIPRWQSAAQRYHAHGRPAITLTPPGQPRRTAQGKPLFQQLVHLVNAGEGGSQTDYAYSILARLAGEKSQPVQQKGQ